MLLELINAEMADYLESLISFAKTKHILLLVRDPLIQIDHLAVKLADSESFERGLLNLQAHASRLTMTQMEGQNRRIATALLKAPLALHSSMYGGVGSVDLLEIIEPRPERGSRGLVGIDHIEIVVP